MTPGRHTVLNRNADLLEIIGALKTPRGRSRPLHGDGDKGEKKSRDRNRHEQLDDRESRTAVH
jgi:hypothetical protein